jgi:predicted lysophospholipase L1 biosynthesis ABC-type transport system permease subunit
MPKDEKSDLVAQLQPIARDAERLTALHAELLRSELRQTAAAVEPALLSIGTGAGIAATAGLLASLALVHGLHRSTWLPLWGCYGIVGAVLGTVGVGLMGSGRRRLSSVNFIPYETLATLQEDIAWATEKTK